MHFDIQVRMDGKWATWVQRHTLADARLTARQLRLAKFTTPDPWWDKVRWRIRPFFM